MDIQYDRLKDGQEQSVVSLIQGLIADYGAKFESKLDAQALRDHRGLINIEVAEESGAVIGFCAWTWNFSTWRGIRGIYVADLCVKHVENRIDIAHNLLKLAARTAKTEGAEFIRAEVDITEEAYVEVFQRAGFWSQKRHAMHFLEPDKFAKFTTV